jgi:hypothetical protein
MRAAFLSTDDQLLARLHAPPELGDGVQSLDYWRKRSQRLPWYRFGARREAARMTLQWEQRVRRALVSQRGVPVATRASAGLLVARIRTRRWGRRGAILMTAAVCVAVMSAPFVAAAVLLMHVL